jgi:thiol:disulfide interchange protein
MVLAVCVPFALAKVFTANGVTWNTELSKGLAQAKSENKFVLADVYTDWCVYCKKLDKVTFSDPAFATYLNSQFVCVKCNAEDNGEGQRAAEQYHVGVYPSALVFDPDGKVVGRVTGFMPAKVYEKQLSKIVNEVGK